MTIIDVVIFFFFAWIFGRWIGGWDYCAIEWRMGEEFLKIPYGWEIHDTILTSNEAGKVLTFILKKRKL